MNRIPGYLDRYPAKMVGRLAARLVNRYARHADLLLDPFCGSSSILKCAGDQGIPVCGIDVNPYAVLMSRVKLEGFRGPLGPPLVEKWIRSARSSSFMDPIGWENKKYWFTAGVLEKYERLRFVAKRLKLKETPEGRAALLALALSVRRCSRADQRSPKPFISKRAFFSRHGKHFDPYKEVVRIFNNLARLYGMKREAEAIVLLGDVRKDLDHLPKTLSASHVITSPPYINAQDYYRNFKFELYILQDLIDFDISGIQQKFIGTERGELLRGITVEQLNTNLQLFPRLRRLRLSHPRKAAIVDRYFTDMHRAMIAISGRMEHRATFVLVCGDNLVGGYSIPTWKILTRILQGIGFQIAECFGDRIECRYVPPVRHGHKGLIKREIVSVFHKVDRT